MKVSIIPLEQLPNQTFWIDLDNQDCKIHIYTRYDYTYIDLSIDDKPLIDGQICLNNTDIVQFTHLNFKGQLRFVDTQGDDDPYFTGFGERFVLAYVQQ